MLVKQNDLLDANSDIIEMTRGEYINDINFSRWFDRALGFLVGLATTGILFIVFNR